MNLTTVNNSSNVAKIGYENNSIEVHFHNGYVYQYPNCTEAMFDEFLSAPSKGQFVHQRLKPHCNPIRIR